MDAIKNFTNWTFLNEPAWRWFIALGLLLVMLAGWKQILSYM